VRRTLDKKLSLLDAVVEALELDAARHVDDVRGPCAVLCVRACMSVRACPCMCVYTRLRMCLCVLVCACMVELDIDWYMDNMSGLGAVYVCMCVRKCVHTLIFMRVHARAIVRVCVCVCVCVYLSACCPALDSIAAPTTPRPAIRGCASCSPLHQALL